MTIPFKVEINNSASTGIVNSALQFLNPIMGWIRYFVVCSIFAILSVDPVFATSPEHEKAIVRINFDGNDQTGVFIGSSGHILTIVPESLNDVYPSSAAVSFNDIKGELTELTARVISVNTNSGFILLQLNSSDLNNQSIYSHNVGKDLNVKGSSLNVFTYLYKENENSTNELSTHLYGSNLEITNTPSINSDIQLNDIADFKDHYAGSPVFDENHLIALLKSKNSSLNVNNATLERIMVDYKSLKKIIGLAKSHPVVELIVDTQQQSGVEIHELRVEVKRPTEIEIDPVNISITGYPIWSFVESKRLHSFDAMRTKFRAQTDLGKADRDVVILSYKFKYDGTTNLYKYPLDVEALKGSLKKIIAKMVGIDAKLLNSAYVKFRGYRFETEWDVPIQGSSNSVTWSDVTEWHVNVNQ